MPKAGKGSFALFSEGAQGWTLPGSGKDVLKLLQGRPQEARIYLPNFCSQDSVLYQSSVFVTESQEIGVNDLHGKANSSKSQLLLLLTLLLFLLFLLLLFFPTPLG